MYTYHDSYIALCQQREIHNQLTQFKGNFLKCTIAASTGARSKTESNPT